MKLSKRIPLFLALALFLMPSDPVDATSLWKRRSDSMAIAYKPDIGPGDILMITIKEKTVAQHNFKTQVDDESTVTSDVMGRLRDILSLANAKPINKIVNTLANATSNQNHATEMQGEGKITANASLDTFITVMVKKILPNGNLFVEGNKSVKVNGEKQLVSLSGIVRPADVMDNTVESNKVANAQISFDGKGAFDGIRKPGFLQKMLNVLF